MLFIKTIVIATLVALSYLSPVSAQTLQQTIDKFCRKDCVSAEKLTHVAKKAGQSYKVDHRAILAIVHVESKYHIKAKNGSSVGLTQVLLRYHRPKFKTNNPYNVEDNVFTGASIFRDCLRRTRGDYEKAFRCYNGGGDPRYVPKMRTAYSMMRSLELPKTSEDPLLDFLVKRGVANPESVQVAGI